MRAAPSVSLSGVPFAQPRDLLLKAVKRAHGYEGDVWVSAPMASLLGLKLRRDAAAPITLTADNGSCAFHHSSAFSEPLSELRRRLQVHQLLHKHAADSVESQQEANGRCRKQLLRLLPGTADVNRGEETVRPRNTNGEAFPPDVEAKMLSFAKRWHATTGSLPSVYWAAPEEAEYVFQSPFSKSFLQGELNSVAVPHPLVSYATPVLYYNVSGAADPNVYKATNCRRYDPWNYCGGFYTPGFAVVMKRYAVQHGCMHEPRWLTPRRMRWYGAVPSRGVVPLTFDCRGKLLRLANIALSTNPKLLESCCLQLADEGLLDAAEDSFMLLKTQQPAAVNDDDSVDSDAPLLP